MLSGNKLPPFVLTVVLRSVRWQLLLAAGVALSVLSGVMKFGPMLMRSSPLAKVLMTLPVVGKDVVLPLKMTEPPSASEKALVPVTFFLFLVAVAAKPLVMAEPPRMRALWPWTLLFRPPEWPFEISAPASAVAVAPSPKTVLLKALKPLIRWSPSTPSIVNGLPPTVLLLVREPVFVRSRPPSAKASAPRKKWNSLVSPCATALPRTATGAATRGRLTPELVMAVKSAANGIARLPRLTALVSVLPVPV